MKLARLRIIVTIGGGEIRKRETLAIDKEIIRLSGKKRPKLLFIPTASSDAERYWEAVQKYFGDYLGCKTDVLFLIKEKPARSEIKKKILSSDIIYVGGGNTLKMMKLWRRLGVDRVLKIAYQKGIVLSGISAGSICWFEAGLSDSMSFYHPKSWKYIKVRGLGMLKGIHCPHYDSKGRKKGFQNMIQKIGGQGIAIENNCAIEFMDGKYFKIITSKPRAKVYRVYKKYGKVIQEKIAQKKELSPMRKLYSNNLF